MAASKREVYSHPKIPEKMLQIRKLRLREWE